MKSDLQKIIDFVHSKYAIEIMLIEGVKEGFDIAGLANKKLTVNTESRDEVGVMFVIAHLFGHTVQYTRYEKYRHLIEKVKEPKPLNLSEDFKKEFYEYEVEGYKIGKGLLETVLGNEKASHLDERYQIYLEVDFTTFWEYLISGKQIPVPEFNKLLNQRYEDWKGKYPTPLPSFSLPEQIVFSGVIPNIEVY